jgi:hypothetical protein
MDVNPYAAPPETEMDRCFDWRLLCIRGLLLASGSFVISAIIVTMSPLPNSLAGIAVMLFVLTAFAVGLVTSIVGGIGWAALVRKPRPTHLFEHQSK